MPDYSLNGTPLSPITTTTTATATATATATTTTSDNNNKYLFSILCLYTEFCCWTVQELYKHSDCTTLFLRLEIAFSSFFFVQNF